MWTQFWDMHSGGGLKEPWQLIYIEAPEEEAKVIFYNRFGHSPERVSCTCCGEDYSISSHESLAQLTGFNRDCPALERPRDEKTGLYLNDDPVIQSRLYLEAGEEPPEGYLIAKTQYIRDKYVPFEEWLTHDGEKDYQAEGIIGGAFKLIRAADILPEERKGEVPEQGYVWRD